MSFFFAKGYGFVTFGDASEAEKCVRLAWIEVDGRKAQVSIATAKEAQNAFEKAKKRILTPQPPSTSEQKESRVNIGNKEEAERLELFKLLNYQFNPKASKKVKIRGYHFF